MNLGKWKKRFDTIECPYCGHGQFLNGYTFLHGDCIISPYDRKSAGWVPNYCPRCGHPMKQSTRPVYNVRNNIKKEK